MRVSPRRRLRIAVAGMLHHTGLLRLLRWLRCRLLFPGSVCVLGLHRVLREQEHPVTFSPGTILLKEATFVKLLEYLGERFAFVSTEDLWRQRDPAGESKKPLCILTFDDGWKDNFTTAYPCLKKLGIPATIFLTTGFIEHGQASWVESLSARWRNAPDRERILEKLDGLGRGSGLYEAVECLKHMSSERRSLLLQQLGIGPQPGVGGIDNMMTWDEILQMHRQGIEFGGHSVTHPLLVYEDDTSLRREVDLCKQTLEARLQRDVTAFAYPNGDWDARVRRAVQEAGFRCAFSVRSGWHRRGEDLFAVPRILLHEGNVTGADGEFSPAALELTLTGWR